MSRGSGLGWKGFHVQRLAGEGEIHTKPLCESDNLEIDGFNLTVEDNNKFSVIIPKDVSMNRLFENDSFKQLEVTNIKNQTNRLEELFLNLTSKK